MKVKNLKNIAACLVIFSLLFVGGVAHAKTSRTFFEKVQDKMMEPLDRIWEWVYMRNARENQDDLTSQNYQKAKEATEKSTKNREEYTDFAVWLVEQGVEEVADKPGQVKQMWDFVASIFSDDDDEKGERLSTPEEDVSEGLDADLINRIYKEMREKDGEGGVDVPEAEKMGQEVDRALGFKVLKEKPSKPLKPAKGKKVKKDYPGCLNACCRKLGGKVMAPGKYKAWSASMRKKHKKFYVTYWDPLPHNDYGCFMKGNGQAESYLPCTEYCAKNYRRKN